MQTYIIFIKICLTINITNLIILNFYLLKFYINIFLNVNIILIFIYFIVGFFITNILKSYRYSGSLHIESKPQFLYTVNFKLKNQLKSWYKRIIHYRKTDKVQIPFICHFLLYYARFLTISYIHILLLHIFIHLLFFLIKISAYIFYTIILVYHYYILFKNKNPKDLYSFNEYSILTQYTRLNVNNLKYLFDEYGNFNWYYEEEFNINSFKKYLLIWFILYIVLKPYYITFNHFISITYIFSQKQLIIDSVWDKNLEQPINIYIKIDNIFWLKLKLIIFLIYFLNTTTGFIIRYFQNYMKYMKRLSLEAYLYESNDLYIHKIQHIILLSMGLSNFKKISLYQWGSFKRDIRFGHENYPKYNFVKRITKDEENFIYIFPLIVHNTLSMQIIESINFVYTIVYGTKNKKY